jgi:hypothetical protein
MLFARKSSGREHGQSRQGEPQLQRDADSENGRSDFGRRKEKPEAEQVRTVRDGGESRRAFRTVSPPLAE